MNRLLPGSLTFVLATAVLCAQDPPPVGENPAERTGETTVEKTTGETPEKSSPEADRVAQRAQDMRDQLGRGKPVKSHVRVQVRLKNGNRLRGVVKDGRLVERVNGLRFVDANAADKGAGIRIWYSGGTRNYVFVPFEELETYQVLQRLSAKELAEIEAELQMQEQRREEQLRAAQLARKDAADEAEPVAAGPGGETAGKNGEVKTDPKTDKAGAGAESKAEAAQQELHRKWFKLLQDYPPDGGWNVAKRDEIERRFAVIGARPSEFEQRFVDEFADWQKACAHFGAKPNEGEKKDAGGGEAGDDKKSRRSSRKK